ncbi:MAG: hypothetical protein HYV16_13050 [Gammaproteobacteria bacterium]|nr:hypothetical protein [Gammaproteobacteria bacterium]
MRKWLDQRSLKLLMSLNEVPFNDEHDMTKLKLIREAMREVAGEIMARAVRRTRESMAQLQAHRAMAAKALERDDEF